jgi:hypothetical protein
MCTRLLGLFLAVAVAGPWLVAPAPALSQPAASKVKEMAARKAFAAGDWDKALDLFSDLYAETLHPVYLRNIGRCHQKKRDPQKALDAFHDYLAKSKSVSADERREIDGYMKEMESLRDELAQKAVRDQQAVQAKTERPLPPPPPLAATTLATEPVPPAAEPVYKKWWLWTALGAVVAGGIVAAVVVSKSGSPMKVCPVGVVTCQ